MLNGIILSKVKSVKVEGLPESTTFENQDKLVWVKTQLELTQTKRFNKGYPSRRSGRVGLDQRAEGQAKSS